MPFVDSPTARVHWQAMGQGEPVVLIMGLGCSPSLWFRVAPWLARDHRVILLDNRGSGQTQASALVYRVGQMAADVAAVLDAAGESSAHVVGFSMGGMIAQQFAVDHPARLRGLALLGTHSGNLWAKQAAPGMRRLLFTMDSMTAERGLQAIRPYTYAAGTGDDRVAEDARMRLAHAPTSRGYQAQLSSLLGWQADLELPRLRVPTLVMHGLQDALIPPQNGRAIASRTPGAHLIELDGASHWLITDQTERCVEALQSHIESHGP